MHVERSSFRRPAAHQARATGDHPVQNCRDKVTLKVNLKNKVLEYGQTCERAAQAILRKIFTAETLEIGSLEKTSSKEFFVLSEIIFDESRIL